LRAPVRKEVEALRAEGKVGSSLQAEVSVTAPAADYELLASLGADLKFLMIASAARVVRGEELAAKVVPSAHPKCERCWHYLADVNGEGLCGRCQSNLRGPGEIRKHV
jgi:isoleucyl-tRNA synthetase